MSDIFEKPDGNATMRKMSGKQTGVLIIGAGQQGMALGKALKDRGISYVILETGTSVGEQWRRHYDSLTLFTPRRYSALPGLLVMGEQDGFPTKDEFADYLKAYAAHFNLPIVFNAPVTKLTKEGGVFALSTPQGSFSAESVVIATGSPKPYIPPFAEKLDGYSIHSSKYKNLAQVPGENLLVVGNGNSAAQIAIELSKTRRVTIAFRRSPRTIPQNVLGRNMYWWMELFGIMNIPSDSFIGKFFAREKDFVVGRDLPRAIAQGKIRTRIGVQNTASGAIVFDDGAEEKFDAVIWATGFRPDYSWLAIPEAFKPDGSLNHRRGVSSLPGLYFAGLRNQLTNVSSNIYGAQWISKFLASKISQSLKQHG